VTAPARRLLPVTSASLDADERELMRGQLGLADRYLSTASDAPALPAILGLLAHHPRLAAAWLALGSSLLEEPVIDARERELLILRVGWRTQCAYVWTQHIRIGLASGLTAAEAAAAGSSRSSADGGPWNPREHALLTAADQMVDQQSIDDLTWATLAREFDERQLLEVLFVVGTYACLAMVVNAAGLQPDQVVDDDAIALPAREG
jgi:4-carboxymuconolactone decarboxylase